MLGLLSQLTTDKLLTGRSSSVMNEVWGRKWEKMWWQYQVDMTLLSGVLSQYHDIFDVVKNVPSTPSTSSPAATPRLSIPDIRYNNNVELADLVAWSGSIYREIHVLGVVRIIWKSITAFLSLDGTLTFSKA